MFNWLFGKSVKELEEQTKKSFNSVKEDIEKAGKWFKHLDDQDKQVFDLIKDLKSDLTSIKDEIEQMKNVFALEQTAVESKQVFKKLPVLDKQTAVGAVQKAVQTPVQTANFYGILNGLSSNERALVLTLMNSDLKLSYEDLALLLGKERSTIRGQINSIKQKSEGLIMEISEKNGKKRVYVPEEMREKLHKYAKVRVKGGKKTRN
tara:strand:+ start:110 stop:727 length:618 start_codon:yes stop_codon:yes gene_type:complete